MKRMFSLVLALLLAPAAWAVGGPYEKGTHYDEIAAQSTAKPEVKEFFSFYCPHCNAFEPIMNELIKKLPAGTEFKKYHVDFMGQASQPVQQSLTEAMILAKLKGKSDAVNAAFFRHIHTDHQKFTSAEDVKAVAVANGLDAVSYDKDVKSFTVQAQVKRMQKEQKDLSEAKIMNGVPTIIVNGRYKININKLDEANVKADLDALIHQLLAQ